MPPKGFQTFNQTTRPTMCKRNDNWQGGKWCRQSTRLAIYIRDGMACVYCGGTVEDGGHFTLDHLTPVSRGGDNKPTNLVTACTRCNSSRGTRSVAAFAQAVALYLDEDASSDTASAIVKHVNNCRRRTLPRKEARALLTRRGTVKQVLNGGE